MTTNTNTNKNKITTKLITKQHFTYYINKLKELSDIEEKLNESSGILNFSISFGAYEELIISILEKVFDDEENYWISYFVYDLSYGTDWHEGCIVTKDGVDVPMRDAGDLYDVLMDSVNED
jgi:hypothetical protein